MLTKNIWERNRRRKGITLSECKFLLELHIHPSIQSVSQTNQLLIHPFGRGQEDLFQNISDEIKEKGENSQAEDIENDRQVIVFNYTFCDMVYIFK